MLTAPSSDGDAEQLAQHFVAQLCAKYRLPLKRFEKPRWRGFAAPPWPGNVRKLENWVHRALLMADGLTIRAPLGNAPAAAA